MKSEWTDLSDSSVPYESRFPGRGVRVLLLDNRNPFYPRVEFGRRSEYGNTWSVENPRGFEATHWQHIPFPIFLGVRGE